MTSKKYPTVRISPEAKEQLRKLSDENGIPMAKYLDRLFGVEDSETPLSHLDQKPPMLGGATLGEFFQQQFNHNEQAKKEAFTNKEIHKDALDSVFDDPYYIEANEVIMSARLGISGDSVESIRKKYDPVEKPDTAITAIKETKSKNEGKKR